MFDKIQGDCNYLSGMLAQKQERVVRNNAEYFRAEECFQTLAKNMTTLEDYLSTVQDMIREITIVIKDYKNERKSFIENKICKNLEFVFDEGYEVSFDIKPYRDKTKATLNLWAINSAGKREQYVPSEQNGGLCRQVISASFGMAVAELLNCKILFLDEAFNGGDPVKLQRVQLILREWIDNGGSIVLNEHNPALYSNLPCRVYEIEKTGKGFEGYVVVKDIIEQEGSVFDGEGYE